MKIKNLVELANFRTGLEAEMVAGFLDEAAIPYLIQSAEGAGFLPTPRGATIMVRPRDLERAREAIATGPQDEGR